MSRIRTFLTSKFFLAAGVIVISGAFYVASLPSADAVIGPGVCTYYKDATYRKAVGARGTGCCGSVISWGIVTAYRKCNTLYCTDQICPN